MISKVSYMFSLLHWVKFYFNHYSMHLLVPLIGTNHNLFWVHGGYLYHTSTVYPIEFD